MHKMAENSLQENKMSTQVCSKVGIVRFFTKPPVAG